MTLRTLVGIVLVAGLLAACGCTTRKVLAMGDLSPIPSEMGENVRVSTVAIAQGNLTIRITEEPQVSQPQPFGDGSTVVVPRTDIAVDEEKDRKLGVVRGGVTLQQLVNGLNALGVGPRDLIAILQAIKASGALHAEIDVM